MTVIAESARHSELEAEVGAEAAAAADIGARAGTGSPRDFVTLVKPRITTLVIVTTLGGYYLAPRLAPGPCSRPQGPESHSSRPSFSTSR